MMYRQAGEAEKGYEKQLPIRCCIRKELTRGYYGASSASIFVQCKIDLCKKLAND
jgi:hypothetical protein